MRYISISKGGTLAVWNSTLNITKQLRMCGEPFDKTELGRRCCITDGIYMANVHKIAVATMSRGIHFFDVATTNCFEQFYLFGLNHFATALSYWYDKEDPGEKCVLMWGDESGSVNLLWFLQPSKGLFETKFTKQTASVPIFMPDICTHSELVTFQNIPHIHSQPINSILYEHHGELIITSSESTSSSVVIIDVHQKRQKYTWRIRKGVKCFDFSSSHSLLVTAGVDPAVRMWNRYVTSQPIAVLRSHKTNVVDVAIHQAMSKIFSYAKDSVVNIWDIPSQQCVKTIDLKFPHLQAGRVLEHGPFPLLLSLTADPALLVTCREYIAMLRLHKTESSRQHYTCALYSPHLEQVITACADSSLAVWDVQTGLKKMEIRNAHSMEKISCITLDRSQHRLISAATNGTIKVWNALNGHNLHKLEAVSETEVTGIICHHDNQLIATGWSRLIAQYNIGFSNDTYVKADLSLEPGCQHSEDIIAMDHCPSLGILATGSFDGEIIMWNMGLQRSITRLQRSPPDKMGGKQRLYPPVHRLLFLQRRAQKNVLKNSAVLLSSQAGSVCWWSIYGPKHKHGQFYVPGESNKSVTGLSSDQENGLLVTGDTTGSIKVWDISQYALSAGDESSTELPPLLHSWRGHEGALESSEILAYGSRLFVLTVSSDCRACLWTIDGGYVGCFGQEEKWDISNPDTYQMSRNLV
ncbi:WD repeat-containing protein 49 isoform X2 [Triplophysa dalaica]|nr:WD repeat-containing protein 49 isoform X2 [Triplophysa dalaica]XP_056627858.1 WD repeat-containing protein 49 isoform X2 [Triplophysa dalaica]